VQRAVVVGPVTNVKRRQRGKDCAGKKRQCERGKKKGQVLGWPGGGVGKNAIRKTCAQPPRPGDHGQICGGYDLAEPMGHYQKKMATKSMDVDVN